MIAKTNKDKYVAMIADIATQGKSQPALYKGKSLLFSVKAAEDVKENLESHLNKIYASVSKGSKPAPDANTNVPNRPRGR